MVDSEGTLRCCELALSSDIFVDSDLLVEVTEMNSTSIDVLDVLSFHAPDR